MAAAHTRLSSEMRNLFDLLRDDGVLYTNHIISWYCCCIPVGTAGTHDTSRRRVRQENSKKIDRNNLVQQQYEYSSTKFQGYIYIAPWVLVLLLLHAAAVYIYTTHRWYTHCNKIQKELQLFSLTNAVSMRPTKRKGSITIISAEV